MRTLFVLLLITFCCIVSAQEPPPPLQIIVEPKTPVTKRVMFLLDRSGSMHGNALSMAVNALLDISEQNVDEFDIALIAFNDSLARWPGIPGSGTPRGWASMPSDKALQNMKEWVNNFNASSNTHLIPALIRALSEQRDELTIIIISDGQFNDPTPNTVPPIAMILNTIAVGQQERAKMGFQPANIICYGIGPINENLRVIGALGGGYFCQVPPPEEEELVLPGLPNIQNPPPLPPLPPLPPPPNNGPYTIPRAIWRSQ